MIFLVVNINNYDLLLGLDFFTKIGMVVDVKKGVMQVWNGPNVLVEVLPFNVVNMLQRIVRLEEVRNAKMREDFSRMNLEQLCATEDFAWDFTSTHLDSTTCIDDFLFKEDLSEVEGNADDNLYKILPIKKIMIEKLNNHGMNEVVEDETPMQILNLVLRKQQQKLLEGWYIKDDDYEIGFNVFKQRKNKKINILQTSVLNLHFIFF